MQTKNQKTCHDANKKDQMQTKKIGCKQKRSDANKNPKNLSQCKQKILDANKKPKPVTMQALA